MEGKGFCSIDQGFEWEIYFFESVVGGGLGISFSKFRCVEEEMKLIYLKYIKEVVVVRIE